MPPDSDHSHAVLLFARGQETLRVAQAEACGQRVYVGFLDSEPLVVATEAWASLGALLKAIGLLKREEYLDVARHQPSR